MLSCVLQGTGRFSLQQQPLGAKDDLDVFVDERIFERGQGDRAPSRPGCSRPSRALWEIGRRAAGPEPAPGPGGAGRRRARRAAPFGPASWAAERRPVQPHRRSPARERWTSTISSVGSKSALPYWRSEAAPRSRAGPGPARRRAIACRVTSGYDGLDAFIGGGITSLTGGPSITVPFLLASSASRAAVVMKSLPSSVTR